MEFGSVVGLVSASTALVASIVGPFITLTVARRQYNATVISVSRQKWIETLRDTLAELIALLRAALVVKSMLILSFSTRRLKRQSCDCARSHRDSQLVCHCHR